MPRIARVVIPDSIHHVLNRGNRRARIFHKNADYMALVNLLGEAVVRFRMRLLAYCLMPNHWHQVLWARAGDEISAYLQWLTNAHVRRHHQHHGSTGAGHVYQGRFGDFLVQSDAHLLTVLRYVEGNPLRAGLVRRAEDWPWSSLSRRFSEDGTSLVTDPPVDRPGSWVDYVNLTMPIGQLGALRQSARRGRPFGSHAWQVEVADRHGLGFTMRPRGRPAQVCRSAGRGKR